MHKTVRDRVDAITKNLQEAFDKKLASVRRDVTNAVSSAMGGGQKPFEDTTAKMLTKLDFMRGKSADAR